jgi:hypothetical protein
LPTFECHAIGWRKRIRKSNHTRNARFSGLRSALGRAIVVLVLFSLFDIVEILG